MRVLLQPGRWALHLLATPLFAPGLDGDGVWGSLPDGSLLLAVCRPDVGPLPAGEMASCLWSPSCAAGWRSVLFVRAGVVLGEEGVLSVPDAMAWAARRLRLPRGVARRLYGLWPEDPAGLLLSLSVMES